MKFTPDNRLLLNKGNKYFKLFKLLFEQNQKNRKKNRIDKNILDEINNNYYNESKNYYDNNIKKPITIEHFINEDIFINKKLKEEFDLGIYYNGENTKSISNDGKNSNNKYNYLDNSNYKSRNHSSISIFKKGDFNTNKLYNNNYKKIINKRIKTNFFKEKNFSSSLNNDYNNIFFPSNKNYNNNCLTKLKNISLNKKLEKRNSINICLVPKNLRYKTFIQKSVSSRSSHDVTKQNNSNKNSSLSKYNQNSIKYSKLSKHNNAIDSKIFKKNYNFNDMNQINRFRNIKKNLVEERVKINNMMSEFFKNPLYIKYNRKDILLDLIRQKNILSRPKSALSCK